jgi:hypothetical protein
MHGASLSKQALAQEERMVRIYVRHNVKDYGKWRKMYDGFDQERSGMGVTGHQVYRSIAKPNELTIWHDFETADKAKAFIKSARLKEVMKQGGVKGTPTVWLVKPA